MNHNKFFLLVPLFFVFRITAMEQQMVVVSEMPKMFLLWEIVRRQSLLDIMHICPVDAQDPIIRGNALIRQNPIGTGKTFFLQEQEENNQNKEIIVEGLQKVSIDIVPLVQDQAKIGLSLAEQADDNKALSVILKKVQLGVTVSKQQEKKQKNQNNKVIEGLKRVYAIKNIEDMLPVIQDQAEIGLSLAKQVSDYNELSEILTKAQWAVTSRSITNHNMRNCLKTLEQFFTSDTKRFKVFHKKRTLDSARLLLADNYKALKRLQ